MKKSIISILIVLLAVSAVSSAGCGKSKGKMDPDDILKLKETSVQLDLFETANIRLEVPYRNNRKQWKPAYPLFGITPLRGTFPCSSTKFPAISLQISRIFANIAYKLCIMRL